MDRKLKVLELFSGTQSISKEFRNRGHKTLTVDYNPIFSEDNNEYGIKTDLTMNILDLTKDMIIDRLGGTPDVIWNSPDCTSYSIAAIYHHRTKEEDGNLAPKSEKAKISDTVTQKSLEIISWFPDAIYFTENPRGGMRKMSFMQNMPRYTITYCQYGDTRMKPTDIWTNHPSPCFRKMCKNGDPCHTAAPRGSSTGTQGLKNAIERSRIPEEFCAHIVDISESYYDRRFQIIYNEFDDNIIEIFYNISNQQIETYINGDIKIINKHQSNSYTTESLEEEIDFGELIVQADHYIEDFIIK